MEERHFSVRFGAAGCGAAITLYAPNVGLETLDAARAALGPDVRPEQITADGLWTDVEVCVTERDARMANAAACLFVAEPKVNVTVPAKALNAFASLQFRRAGDTIVAEWAPDEQAILQKWMDTGFQLTWDGK